MDFKLNIDPVIAISVLHPEVSVDITPTPDGKSNFRLENINPNDNSTGFNKVTVSTNNLTGYTLTMSDEDNDTALKHTVNSIDAKINSISGITNVNNVNELENFLSDPIRTNFWGYISSGLQLSFKRIPPLSNADTLKTTNAPSTDDGVAVMFIAKANTDLPSGSYKDTIVFTATTNYVPSGPRRFFDTTKLANMQDMTEALCAEVDTPSVHATEIVTSPEAYTDILTQVPEITLTDTRDNKTYKVRKLADGNCWMSENLRLGGTNTIALNSTNSNLPEGSTFTLPIAETSANHTAWATGPSDSTGANTPHVYNTENNSYGNYYNWYTAVAGTANYSTVSQNNSGTITPNDAPGSICPKGWYLPGNGNNADYKNLLITTYGLTKTTGSNSTNATKMQSNPLNFVMGGGYDYTGTADGQGQGGGYWSRTPLTVQARAFGLSFGAVGSLGPQGSSDKVFGVPVRCVASPAPSAPFMTPPPG